MKTITRVRALPFAIASLLAIAPVAAQNITTSGATGRVVDANGQPVSGATVTIVHEPSGTTKTVTTDEQGRYAAQGLRVGGPFQITAHKDGLADGERDAVFLQLGQPSAINLTLGGGAAAAKTLGTVNVTMSALAQTFSPENKGLSTTVSQRQLQATPQGNRSIDDVVRLDPRITVTDQGTGAFSAAGMNNRFNNIAVDGVTQGDPFGLNANGLPYQKSPISPETIAEYNISTANFDTASDTVGADVNAVTKSGTNAFHGSVYYSYRNANHLVGDAGWLDSSNSGYHYNGYDKDTTFGANVGGPIVKDKLFFFVSAEHEKTTGIGADSANGLDESLGNGPSTSNKVSPGDLQKIIDAAKALGLTPGTFGGPTGLTYDDKRYLGKIDWNISDNHRASFTYQRTKEMLPAVGGNSPKSVGLTSYTYTKEITTDNYVAHLYDDWSEDFTTEAKVGFQKYVQDTTAPYQQPSINVNLSPDGKGPSVNLGEERYRHYNHIDTKKVSVFLAGTYYLGDHAIKGGIDYQRNKINNLFGQAEFGVYTFWGIDNFAAGNYNRYDLYHPAPGYQLADIAGKWTYSQYSPFLQDTWQVNDKLSLQYGVRVDIPHSDGTPVYNPAFEQAFGYPNNYTVGSSNRVVEPRVSFNYLFDSEYQTQLRGGVGLFQTNPPTVWMTNPFQNNGVTLLNYTSYDPSGTPFSADPYNQNIPAGGGAGSIDTIDRNFRLPTVWKASLAFDRELPWMGLLASAEYQHIQVRDGILYQAVNYGDPTGVLPDGRFTYYTDPSSGPVLIDPATGATVIDPVTGKPVTNRPDANHNPAFSTASTLLTNTHKGKSDSLTLGLTKPFSDSWSGNVSLTFNHATDVDPGTDTIAYNGYQRVARLNPNSNVLATSNYNVAKVLKASLTWQHAFFGDYNTQVSAFYSGHTGLPYTWVFGNDANGDSVSGWDPVYIPGVDDPKVAFAPGTSQQVIDQFQAFLGSQDYLKNHRGQIAARNGDRTAWVNELDMSFSQEVPGIFKGNKGELRLDVYNFLNLLNKDWGQQRNTGIYPTRVLANYTGVNADGQYVYSLPTDKAGNYQPQQLQTYDGGFYDPSRVVSRWSAMLTLRYSF